MAEEFDLISAALSESGISLDDDVSAFDKFDNSIPSVSSIFQSNQQSDQSFDDIFGGDDFMSSLQTQDTLSAGLQSQAASKNRTTQQTSIPGKKSPFQSPPSSFIQTPQSLSNGFHNGKLPTVAAHNSSSPVSQQRSASFTTTGHVNMRSPQGISSPRISASQVLPPGVGHPNIHQQLVPTRENMINHMMAPPPGSSHQPPKFIVMPDGKTQMPVINGPSGPVIANHYISPSGAPYNYGFPPNVGVNRSFGHMQPLPDRARLHHPSQISQSSNGWSDRDSFPHSGMGNPLSIQTPALQQQHSFPSLPVQSAQTVMEGSVGFSSFLQHQQSAPSGQFFSPGSRVTPPISNSPLTPLGMSGNGFDFNFATGSSEGKSEQSQNIEETLDPVVEEEETLTHAETFANYQPSRLTIGQPHPDNVVETSSLSSVQPPKIWYTMALPEETIDSASLSALQLEAITYSCQRHERFLANGERAGFLIGDGAGVGKGRTIAGIIFENYLLERKRALWVSVSNDLKYDAARDLKDVGAGHIPVFSLNKFKYSKINGKENGSVKKGVIFSTYSSLISESSTTSNKKMKTRLSQLFHWFEPDFDGCLIFDECHRAKNLVPTGGSKPTKTGQVVLELQRLLPKARVVYASATGASEPKNMAYMTRLGLWGQGTPFADFHQFIQAIERRGVGAMEIVAMDMKLRGMYLARQLSFQGVAFKIEEIPLASDFERMYNEAVALWVKAREYFAKAATYTDEDGGQKSSKMMWGQFWSSHQRFFKYLCIASKVKHVVSISRSALKNNKCIVIGLQSTGEARTIDQIDMMGGGDQLDDFVSTAKGVFQSLVERHFPMADGEGRLGAFDKLFDNKVFSEGSPGANLGKKRKLSGYNSDESDNNSGNLSDAGFGSDGGFSGSDSEQECNPFGSSDEDSPWLKKQTKKKKKRKHEDRDPYHSNKSVKKQKREEIAPQLTSTPNRVPGSSKNSAVSSEDGAKQCAAMRTELLDMLELLDASLPANTLDQLIDELGGTENVAEMTGRKGRVVSNEMGNIQYEKRSETLIPLEVINLTEKKRFMDLEKKVAIISEAASSGISLQSDRRAKNQLRRVHITMELPWSADRAVQQFGRTHRSNQVSAPEYLMCISALAGERRFASIVAKRLECLGALTHGDRRATEAQDLSSFNIDNKYGRLALDEVYHSIITGEDGKVPPPKSYRGNDFVKDMRQCLVDVGLSEKITNGQFALEKDASTISKFLNRILGMPVKHQNCLFEYFTNTLEAIILDEKRCGKFDLGILDLGKNGEKITKTRLELFSTEYLEKSFSELQEVCVERGMSYEEAVIKSQMMKTDAEGFYIDKVLHGMQRKVVLVTAVKISNKKVLFTITRPNLGMLAKYETLDAIKESLRKIEAPEAKELWEQIHKNSELKCSHQMYHGSCRRKVGVQGECDVGKRTKKLYVLSGSVLSIWTKVENVLASVSNSKMQVIRLKTSENQKVVGLLIPNSAVNRLKEVLSESSSSS